MINISSDGENVKFKDYFDDETQYTYYRTLREKRTPDYSRDIAALHERVKDKKNWNKRSKLPNYICWDKLKTIKKKRDLYILLRKWIFETIFHSAFDATDAFSAMKRRLNEFQKSAGYHIVRLGLRRDSDLKYPFELKNENFLHRGIIPFTVEEMILQIEFHVAPKHLKPKDDHHWEMDNLREQHPHLKLY